MNVQQFRQHPELRQQIVRDAQRQRNVQMWRLLGRLYAALTVQPKALRRSRWLAVHHGS